MTIEALVRVGVAAAMILSTAIGAAAPDAGSSAKTFKPNIIFILADDLGWTDAGVYGSRYYETPNIDRLAAQGMRFTNFHTCQNCAPTRAALMSGQYAPRTGIYNVGAGEGKSDWESRPLLPVNNSNKLPADKITVAQALKTNGYLTGMFGKWHLGDDTKPEYHPAGRGFDEAIVTHGDHFDFDTIPKVEIPPGIYKSDWLTDRAEDFIRRHKDGPFFLYLPHQAVHSPIQAKKEVIGKFELKPPVGGHSNPTYAAMIQSLDESVGRISALLDELKIADNTVLVFASDNGGVGGYDRADGLIRDQPFKEKRFKTEADDGKHITDNTPLRSGKGSLYEGGTRAPFIVRWPGKVNPDSVCDVPTIHVDLYPTLLDFAGAPAPDGYPLDGESLAPLLLGGSDSLKRDAIFQHFASYLGAGPGQWRSTPVATVISGDWKLMEFMEDKHIELYNLRDDIGEHTDLAATNPEKAEALRNRLHAWQKGINAPVLQPNPDIKPPATANGKGRGRRSQSTE